VGDVEGLFCAISYNSITVIQVIASVYRSVYMSFSGQQEKDEQKKKEKSLSFLRRRKRRYDIGKAMLLFLQRNTDRCHHSTYNAESNEPLDGTLPLCIIIFHPITHHLSLNKGMDHLCFYDECLSNVCTSFLHTTQTFKAHDFALPQPSLYRCWHL